MDKLFDEYFDCDTIELRLLQNDAVGRVMYVGPPSKIGPQHLESVSAYRYMTSSIFKFLLE